MKNSDILQVCLGETLLDFLQHVYSTVLTTLAKNVETSYTVLSSEEHVRILNRTVPGHSRYGYDFETSKDFLTLRPRHSRAKHFESDSPTNGPYDVSSLYYSDPVPSGKDGKDIKTTVYINRQSGVWTPDYEKSKEIVIHDWVNLAVVGLSQLSGLIREALKERFFGLINDEYVVGFNKVTVGSIKGSLANSSNIDRTLAI